MMYCSRKTCVILKYCRPPVRKYFTYVYVVFTKEGRRFTQFSVTFDPKNVDQNFDFSNGLI